MSRAIGAAFTDDERAAFIAAARSFLASNEGQPARFAHQARRADRMDCIGLLVLSLLKIGKPVNNRTDYGRAPSRGKLHESMAEHFGTAVDDAPRPGDVVTLAWTEEECHVAIVVDHPARGIGFVHCYLAAGKVIEHGVDETWRRRIIGVFRP